jgi:hypothetical protein
LAAARKAVVGKTVAVVVQAVARFGSGLRNLGAVERSERAHAAAGRADALQTRHAVHASAGIALIHLAVAVVVDPVTHFGARHVSNAHEARGHALAFAFAARTNAVHYDAVGAPTGIALIDLVVAVVIEPVAELEVEAARGSIRTSIRGVGIACVGVVCRTIARDRVVSGIDAAGARSSARPACRSAPARTPRRAARRSAARFGRLFSGSIACAATFLRNLAAFGACIREHAAEKHAREAFPTPFSAHRGRHLSQSSSNEPNGRPLRKRSFAQSQRKSGVFVRLLTSLTHPRGRLRASGFWSRSQNSEAREVWYPQPRAHQQLADQRARNVPMSHALSLEFSNSGM